jgi:type VI secretion system protein ImpL
MLALASRNTDVDSAMRDVFQPVHVVSPPADTTKYIVEANAAYINALAALQAAVAQTAAAPPGQGEASAQQAAQNAANARMATTQLAQGFRIDGVAHLETTVQRLLEAPIAHAEPLLRNFGASDLNGKAGPVCSVARGILNKFPFNPDATSQATMAEVNGFMKPGTGTLWTFYDQTLQRAVERQGNQFKPIAGPVTVAPELIQLLNRAAVFASALYPEGEDEPKLLFTVEPQLVDATAAVSLTIDGQTVRSTRNSRQSGRITWTGGTAREARLAAQIGTAEVTLLSFTGPWSLFQLLREADTWTPGANPGGYRLEWALKTRGQTATLPDGTPFKVTVEMSLGATPPSIFRRNYFQGVGCPAAIAR